VSRVDKTFRKGVKVSERHGAGEWTAERLSSLVLIPLTLWGLWGAWSVAGAGYDGAVAWLGQPVNAAILAGLLLIGLWHTRMGLQVVVDDYIHRPSSRTLLLGLISLVCLTLAAAAVFFIVRLAVGSAPLPAGFGI